jgi:hypothetical protein
MPSKKPMKKVSAKGMAKNAASKTGATKSAIFFDLGLTLVGRDTTRWNPGAPALLSHLPGRCACSRSRIALSAVLQVSHEIPYE